MFARLHDSDPLTVFFGAGNFDAEKTVKHDLRQANTEPWERLGLCVSVAQRARRAGAREAKSPTHSTAQQDWMGSKAVKR